MPIVGPDQSTSHETPAHGRPIGHERNTVQGMLERRASSREIAREPGR